MEFGQRSQHNICGEEVLCVRFVQHNTAGPSIQKHVLSDAVQGAIRWSHYYELSR